MTRNGRFIVNVLPCFKVADIMVLRMANLGRTPKYVRSLRICLTEYLCFTQEQISFYSERKAALEVKKLNFVHFCYLRIQSDIRIIAFSLA